MTRLTYENEIDGKTTKVTIEVSAWDLSMDGFIEQLVRPLCLAAGFHPDTVDDAMPDSAGG